MFIGSFKMQVVFRETLFRYRGGINGSKNSIRLAFN